MTDSSVEDYVKFFDESLSHHRKWLHAVLTKLVAADPGALAEGGELWRIWRGRTGPVMAPAQVAGRALPQVKEFEGCKLEAYPDPETGGEPWTIGWGTTTYATGKPVKQGDVITQAVADALLFARLEEDCVRIAGRVAGWDRLNLNQRAALLSFSYNVGPNWFGGQGFDTITKALREGRLADVPAAMMLYVNQGGPSEAGLRRRRKAEGALWNAGPASAPAAPAPAPAPVAGITSVLKTVPWYPQRDSATGQADRMCFSSSCAMLLGTIKPGTLKGANGDDQYLRVVQRFGDTTDASAQIQALAHFGVTARFVQNADFQLLEQQIARGIPVPCGYIHRGPVNRPTGSGHWLIVIGHTPTRVVVNDPWGEPDLITGDTLNANGKELRFSRQNFGKRWMVEPIGGGAYRHAPGKGWAIVVDSIR
jgi:GH24 family phage-related lysozyme (muramidase)